MPRYKVTSLAGYTVTHASPAGNHDRPPQTSYSVIDTLQCHQEVGRFYVQRGKPDPVRKAAANQLCDDLNHEDETLYGPYD